jgi:hypothetical protein
MGPAIVALKDERHLTAFQRRHSGAHVFRLGDLTEDQFEAILKR